jgi:hypothetical protein
MNCQSIIPPTNLASSLNSATMNSSPLSPARALMNLDSGTVDRSAETRQTLYAPVDGK